MAFEALVKRIPFTGVTLTATHSELLIAQLEKRVFKCMQDPGHSLHEASLVKLLAQDNPVPSVPAPKRKAPPANGIKPPPPKRPATSDPPSGGSSGGSDPQAKAGGMQGIMNRVKALAAMAAQPEAGPGREQTE